MKYKRRRKRTIYAIGAMNGFVEYKRRHKRAMMISVISILLLLLVLVLVLMMTFKRGDTGESQMKNEDIEISREVVMPAYVDVDLIAVDGASRRGVELDSMGGIVIHYIGNPGTTAKQNRDYFNGPESTVSSHFVIGLEGEVIQCVPLEEKSSASNNRNSDTVSIEVCHPDETGRFTDSSYDSLVELTAWLCSTAGLDTQDIIRHYDVTGKECPKYFVDNEEAWLQFKDDVKRKL